MPIVSSPIQRDINARICSGNLKCNFAHLTPTIFPTKSLTEGANSNSANYLAQTPTITKIHPLNAAIGLLPEIDAPVLRKRTRRERIDSLSEGHDIEENFDDLIAPSIPRIERGSRMVAARPKYVHPQCGEDTSLLECHKRPRLDFSNL